MTVENEGTGDVENTDLQTADTGADASKDTQSADKDAAKDNGSSEADKASADPFADLDEDTREWLGKRNVKSPQEAAKLAREQAKLLGNAIRVPGDKATDEEREAFLNKLGRPEKPEGYDFKVPEALPENVPYDGERANGFKQLAHKVGLTAAQAATIHDWAVENAVNDFGSLEEQRREQVKARATEETAKLVKRWGPLDSQTTRANLEFADRALREAGGVELVEEFKRLGLIGENKEILSEPLAVAFANVGMALFKEDDVLRGSADRIGNPFEEGANFNVTKQMQLIKSDPDTAHALIAAAGKKPSEFGLKG